MFNRCNSFFEIEWCLTYPVLLAIRDLKALRPYLRREKDFIVDSSYVPPSASSIFMCTSSLSFLRIDPSWVRRDSNSKIKLQLSSWWKLVRSMSIVSSRATGSSRRTWLKGPHESCELERQCLKFEGQQMIFRSLSLSFIFRTFGR